MLLHNTCYFKHHTRVSFGYLITCTIDCVFQTRNPKFSFILHFIFTSTKIEKKKKTNFLIHQKMYVKEQNFTRDWDDKFTFVLICHLISSHLNTPLPQVAAANRLFRLRPHHRHHFLRPLPLLRFIKFYLFVSTIITTERFVPAQSKKKTS